MTLSDEHKDLVVVHLEEETCDAGHSTLTIHGQSEVVGALSLMIAMFLAAEADEVHGSLPGSEPDEGDLGASA